MSTSEPHHGAPLEAGELVGSLFADRYRIVQLVSDGANTTVYDALDDGNGRAVTVKLIRPEMTASPSFRRRFDETMRSVAALSHPNIAALYDWGITAVGDVSTAFVVAEPLTSGSLRDMFDRNRTLTPSQALSIGLEACRGLDYAHRRGFVHSELTPSKLVFGDDRRLRITDFGLAQLLNEPTWQIPESVSTHVAWYASPEQGLSQPIDGKTDVYALCLTLHEAVTGTLPFRNDSTVASLSARIGKLMPVSADLGPLASVLEHAGRPDADERSSAAELGRELVQAASKLPRPDPLPLLSTGLFDTPMERLRSPDDPTGGVVRPTDDLVISVVDEPNPTVADDVDAPDTGVATADTVGIGDDARSAVDVDPDHDPDDDPDDDGVETETAEATAADRPAESDPLDLSLGGGGDGPASDVADDLVILPLDSEIRETSRPSAVTPPTSEPARPVVETQPIPVAATGEPRRRRRFPWKILLALVVLGALAGLGVLATRLFQTPVYEVPDLVEMPAAEAMNLIATNEWAVTRTDERSDDVSTVGQIVRTAPTAGAQLAQGEPFLIVVSAGPTLRELPESAGLPVGSAQTQLLQLGLEAGTVEAFDEEAPVNTVISWSVPGDATLAAGSLVEPGTTIELVVSIGPEPRIVPDVAGLTLADARATLEELRLTVVQAGQEFSDDVPLGSVLSQEIEPGTEVERGAEIGVVVSRGPDIVPFPDLSEAASYEEAAAILVEAGFEPRLTFGDAQGEIRAIAIDGAEPEVGVTYRRGTQVDIQAL